MTAERCLCGLVSGTHPDCPLHGTPKVARPLEGFTLPLDHPMAGREAWQCVTCEGIFFPERVPPVVCPYCEEDAEE